MATRIKVEAIYTVNDNDVRTEADRLSAYLHDFRIAARSGNAKIPHHDRLEISAERKAWDKLAE